MKKKYEYNFSTVNISRRTPNHVRTEFVEHCPYAKTSFRRNIISSKRQFAEMFGYHYKIVIVLPEHKRKLKSFRVFRNVNIFFFRKHSKTEYI